MEAVESLLPRIQSAAKSQQLAVEELEELCSLASAPVRDVVTNEDHVPTKALALGVLGQCCAAGGSAFGALDAKNAAAIGKCLKTKPLESHAIHALALA